MIINYIILFYFCIGLVHATPVNLITNGSFESNTGAWNQDLWGGTCPSGYSQDNVGPSEQDLTGWTLIANRNSNESMWLKCDANPPPDGTYMFHLMNWDNANRLQQSFSTINGKTYFVKYNYYKRDTHSDSLYFKFATACANPITAFYTDTLTDTTDSFSTGTVQTRSFTFTAQSSTTCLEISDNSSIHIYGYYIDNIQIYEKPVITNTNQSVYPNDPSNLQLKAIPSQVMVFDTGIRNAGGATDTNSSGSRNLYFTFSVPTQISFELNSVTYVDGRQAKTGNTGDPDSASSYTTINNSTLLCCGTAGDIEYSSSGTGGPWTYTPNTDFSADGKNYDNDVRAVRISPRGSFANGSSSPTGFRVYYKGMIK